MTAGNPTIRELLAEGIRRLQQDFAAHGRSASPELDAEVLLAHLLAVPRSHLRSHPEEAVAGTAASYRTLIERRARGEPLAYLTGIREFWSLPFRVTPAVLVPRARRSMSVR